MRSVEVSASTREEAIMMALEKLGAERHEVDVEILDEGSRGLFGIGARPVRLRVTDETARHEPDAQKPPQKQREDTDGEESGGDDEGRQRRSRGRRGGRRGRGGEPAEGSAPPAPGAGGGPERAERPARAERPERAARGEGGERGGRGRRGGRREEPQGEPPQREEVAPAVQAGEPGVEAGGEQEGRGTHSRRRRRGGATRREGVRREPRSRDAAVAESTEPAAPRDEGMARGRGERPRMERGRERSEVRAPREARATREPREGRPAPEPTEPISEERALEASALLSEIIQKMGMEATVAHELQEDGGCILRVSTEDSALLIGRKAQTLLALQYLVNRVIRQHEEENLQLIMVDIEGYIERRREELTELALRMAEQAKEERRRVRLKPLTPQERRIVHVALQDDEELRTFSVGEGAMRSVVIAPKDEEPLPGGRGGRRGGRGGHRENGGERPRRVEGRFAESGEGPEGVAVHQEESERREADSGSDSGSDAGESRRSDEA